MLGSCGEREFFYFLADFLNDLLDVSYYLLSITTILYITPLGVCIELSIYIILVSHHGTTLNENQSNNV